MLLASAFAADELGNKVGRKGDFGSLLILFEMRRCVHGCGGKGERIKVGAKSSWLVRRGAISQPLLAMFAEAKVVRKRRRKIRRLDMEKMATPGRVWF